MKMPLKLSPGALSTDDLVRGLFLSGEKDEDCTNQFERNIQLLDAITDPLQSRKISPHDPLQEPRDQCLLRSNLKPRSTNTNDFDVHEHFTCI